MFQHIAVSQNIPEHLCILLDDGGVGDHIDHPFHSVLCSVSQSKRKRRRRFSTAGRDRQRVNALWFTAGFHAGIQDLAAQAVQLRLRIFPSSNMGFQPFQERRDLVISAPSAVPVHELLSIQKIGVYQAGVEHPRPEGSFQPVSLRRGGRCVRRQRNAALAAVLQASFRDAPLQSTVKCAVPSPVHPRVSKVRQAAVMSRDAGRRVKVPTLRARHRSGGGMIHPWSTAQQPVLEALRAFSTVMVQTDPFPLRSSSKRLRKFPAQFRRASQMLRDGLAAQAVIGNVGVIVHSVLPSFKTVKSSFRTPYRALRG